MRIRNINENVMYEQLATTENAEDEDDLVERLNLLCKRDTPC